LDELLRDSDQEKVEHAFEAMLRMKKLDIHELEAAAQSV